MSKRFTDTDKWDDEWFLSLDNDSRVVWQFLLDKCSIGGCWKKNMSMLNFCCHINWTEDHLLELFTGRIQSVDNFIFVSKFVLFQQKIASLNDLNPSNKCHLSIINELVLKGLLSPSEAPDKGLGRGYSKGIGNGNVKEDCQLCSGKGYLVSQHNGKQTKCSCVKTA